MLDIDIWIDVQRQWVYLEGIFSGSADIKHLLPVESGRFQNINAEFLTVMKKVYKSPFVLDVLNIQGVEKSLERLADLLNKIQKALGEYLERERSSFPRFYFVGDEDLLEIIGNSKDILRIMKHLKKMFAGISTIMLDEEIPRSTGHPRCTSCLDRCSRGVSRCKEISRRPFANRLPGPRSSCRHCPAGTYSCNQTEVRTSNHGASPPKRCDSQPDSGESVGYQRIHLAVSDALLFRPHSGKPAGKVVYQRRRCLFPIWMGI